MSKYFLPFLSKSTFSNIIKIHVNFSVAAHIIPLGIPKMGKSL